MIQQASKSGLTIIRGWGHYIRGAAHYHRNELDAAEEHFSANTESPYSIHVLALHHSILGLALVHQGQGRFAEAGQMIELASQFDIERIGIEEESTRSLRARLALLQGDLESASRWADTYNIPMSDHPMPWLEEPHLTRACILIARNKASDLQTALAILDAFGDLAGRIHNQRYILETHVVRALALDVLGDRSKAQAELERALELAQPEGFVRVFATRGRACGRCCWNSRKLPRRAFLSKRLSAFWQLFRIRSPRRLAQSCLRPQLEQQALEMLPCWSLSPSASAKF